MTLTAEEQAAIDAFPKRKVQKIPRGVSAEPELRWDEKANLLREVKEDGSFLTFAENKAAYRRKMYAGVKKNSERTKRLEWLKEHHHKLSVREMAAHHSLAYETIRNDLRELGLRAGKRLRTPKEIKQLIGKAIAAGVRDESAIAKHAGVDMNSVRRYAPEFQ